MNRDEAVSVFGKDDGPMWLGEVVGEGSLRSYTTVADRIGQFRVLAV
jgi:hypothetical protein